MTGESDVVTLIYESSLDMLERYGIRSVAGETALPFPDDGWAAAGQAGWFRVLAGEDLDGLGLGPIELSAIFRAVGRRPFRGPLLEQAIVAPYVLSRTQGAQTRHLRASLDGEAVIIAAVSPPPPYGEGPDAVSLSGGKLNGQISPVAFAVHASHLLVPCREGADVVLVVVDGDRANVTPLVSKDPTMEYGRVGFENAHITPDSVIARGVDALRFLSEIQGLQRLMAASELSGIVGELTQMSVDHAKTRHQFGRPIGGFQVIRHMLADMAVRATAVRSFADVCVRDAALQSGRVPELGAIAKAYAASVARSIAEESLQIHGAIGFTTEHPLHFYFHRTLTLQGFLGEPSRTFYELGRQLLSEAPAA
jgi:alkylation response protein AidB-like acyl-CoA dehydrogenase